MPLLAGTTGEKLARKDTISSFAMFGPGADMSQASSTSLIASVLNMDIVEIDLSWVGTSPVGAVTVQRSRDKINWITFDFGQTIAISGNSGSHQLIIKDFNASWMQVVYTKTSGTGTLQASLGAKQIGG